MAMSSNRGGAGLHRPLAEINVTPLVDVMLVLLIVFMVTAPMLTTGLKMNLPQARAAKPIEEKKPVVISVTKEGKYALDKDEMALPDLIEAIRGRLNGDMTRIIQVRGDRNGSYGPVMALIDQLVSNGLIHIALISDPKSRRVDAAALSPADHITQAAQADLGR